MEFTAPIPSQEVADPGPNVQILDATAVPLDDGGDDDDDDDVVPEQPVKKRKMGTGRRKIDIEFIEDKIRRHITFSKRKAGLAKKAYELSRLTGAQVLLLISSERGQIYSFATPKLQPILVKQESKSLIESCLNAPDPTSQPNPPAVPQLPPPSMPPQMPQLQGPPQPQPEEGAEEYPDQMGEEYQEGMDGSKKARKGKNDQKPNYLTRLGDLESGYRGPYPPPNMMGMGGMYGGMPGMMQNHGGYPPNFMPAQYPPQQYPQQYQQFQGQYPPGCYGNNQMMMPPQMPQMPPGQGQSPDPNNPMPSRPE